MMMKHLGVMVIAGVTGCLYGGTGQAAARMEIGAAGEKSGPGAPTYLRCEYLVDPIGVETQRPRLSWILSDSGRGAMQGAYRILVASSRAQLDADGGDVWDSGKVDSDQNAQVEYAGPALASAQRVYWKARTWDKLGRESAWSGAATWTMGLLTGEDWADAKWIGLPGENGPAVRAHNGFHSELADRADATKWVALDLGAVRKIDGVRLWPARPFDWREDVPGLMFPVRFRVEVADNAGFENARVVLDRIGADEENPGENAAAYSFEPVEARWVRLTVTRLGMRDPGHFGVALAEMEVVSGGEVVSRGAAVTASDTIETNDWSRGRLTDGDTTSHRGHGATRGAATMVRAEVQIDNAPSRAMLFVTSRGLYEFRINGRKVGDHELAPEWTDYRTRIQYQGYDVTEMLRIGGNALGASIADGWYAGKVGLFANQMYGDQISLLAQLRLEYPDGTTQVVVSGPEWKGTLDGPVRAADILDGETFDGQREMPGWDKPGFDDSTWKPVEVYEAPSAAVVAQTNEPIRVTGDVKPVAITEPAPGIYVVDLGQNLPGRIRLRATGPAGTEVVVRHGEVLDERGRLYTDNLRGAAQTDRFILSGGSDVFEPRFTYHGFRYVQITGLASRPKESDIVARVFHSDSPKAGSFECSNAMLNRLMSNIRWTQYANMMSVPTDCPQRDERLGWMGDAYIFAQTGIYNLNMAAFLAKWTVDIRDAQGADGRYSDVSPNPVLASGKFTSVPGWGDAGVVVPWRVYENYADRRLLEQHYDSARRWVEYIREKNPGLIWEKARGNDYGDWLNGDTLKLKGFPSKGGEVPKEIFATVCFEESCRIVGRMALAIGKPDEAEQYIALADKIRAEFQKRFIAADGKMPGDTQAGYALALHNDLVPEALRPAAFKHLLAAIDRYGGHLSTGFHSTVPMMDELVRSGRTDIAYRMLTSTTFPGWGFMIEQGATSMWERWDGYVKGREGGGFQDPGMNSFNHFAFGAIGEWMYRVIGGIVPDPESPGWRHFFIRPRPGGGVTWAKTSYRSIYGEIKVSWKIDEDRLVMDVTVPPNSWATVDVPTVDAASVHEAGKPVALSNGVTVGGLSAGALRLEVRAGAYRFSAKVPPK